MEQYYAEAVINGWSVDRHQEEAVVDLFAQNIYRAGKEFLSNPMQTPFVPSWNRVISAYPISRNNSGPPSSRTTVETRVRQRPRKNLPRV